MLSVCSHLQHAVKPTLARFDEVSRCNLGSLNVQRMSGTRPLGMEVIVWGVHFSKTNPGLRAEYRAMTHGRHVHTCPLVHQALWVACRLFLQSGAPLKVSDLRNGDWYVLYFPWLHTAALQVGC